MKKIKDYLMDRMLMHLKYIYKEGEILGYYDGYSDDTEIEMHIDSYKYLLKLYKEINKIR